MAKPKVFLVDWLAEARALTNALPKIPWPPGLLVDLKEWKPDRTKLGPIQNLLNLVKVYLTDRIARKTPSVKPAPDHTYGVFTDDPELTWPLLFKFNSELGMTFTDAEQHAFVAHNMLGQILRDGWIDEDLRRQLPTQIASIQGESASARASKIAQKKRNTDRRSTLAVAVSEERGRDPFATAWEVLDRLCGGDVVTDHKDGRVWYRNAKDELVSVGVDRFETIFAEASTTAEGRRTSA